MRPRVPSGRVPARAAKRKKKVDCVPLVTPTCFSVMGQAEVFVCIRVSDGVEKPWIPPAAGRNWQKDMRSNASP